MLFGQLLTKRIGYYAWNSRLVCVSRALHGEFKINVILQRDGAIQITDTNFCSLIGSKAKISLYHDMAWCFQDSLDEYKNDHINDILHVDVGDLISSLLRCRPFARAPATNWPLQICRRRGSCRSCSYLGVVLLQGIELNRMHGLHAKLPLECAMSRKPQIEITKRENKTQRNIALNCLSGVVLVDGWILPTCRIGFQHISKLKNI